MTELQNLIDQARALPAEAARQLQICNACRYCEGFCAVFPAMTRRLTFAQADLHYMANLCHNCGACLHACQYAPPHDFAVNIPQTMAQLRLRTYQDYAWPAPLSRLYQRNGLALVAAGVAGLSLFLMLITQALGQSTHPPRNFYDVLGHGLLVNLFAPVFLLALLALGVGVRRFLKDITPASGVMPPTPDAYAQATSDVLSLRYLDGGHGDGCNNADDAFSHARRHAHHLTFYGFMLCLASTSVATIYHYALHLPAPYDLLSLPKLLGVSGGVMLLLGALGLLWLNLRRHPLQGDAAQKPMDRGFLLLLILMSSTGLGLWLAKGSTTMPLWLCVHLASVMAFFLTLPYSKMVHGVYRAAALLRYAVEKRVRHQGVGGE